MQGTWLHGPGNLDVFACMSLPVPGHDAEGTVCWLALAHWWAREQAGSVQDWPIAKIVTRFVMYMMDTFVYNSYIAKIFDQITGHSSYETFTGPNDF